MIPPPPKKKNLDEHISEKMHIVNITSPIYQREMITVHRMFTFL